MTNFGARFKQARESKGISLDQIAVETRISTRFLSAIENEEFQLLPGGIFNRGFVRAFAEKVGLDPDQAVADYERMAEVRQPEPQAPPEPAPAAKRQRRLYPIAVGILALVIVVFYVVNRESGHIAQTASTPATPPAAVTQPQPASTTPAAPAPSVATPDNAPPTTAASPETQSKPAPKPPEPSPAPKPQAATPAAPPTPGTLSLEIDAQDASWIKVVADGKPANPGEILQAGMTRKYIAQNKLIVSVGNAGGLALKLNDKPMKPLGKNGQVREIVITPETANKFIPQ